jgi:AcrR family transcriptional regulator
MAFADGEGTCRRKDGRDVPTGVAIRDPRGQLFAAAERVLLRDGPAALTSRAVTDEAGVAKGVLHRHFADFDEFLAELTLSRITRLAAQAQGLRDAAGAGTVAGNLAAALPSLFTPPLLALVRLVIARDELRTRLRAATGSRIPLISECVAMVRGYLEAERDLGRITAAADLDTLAPMLVSAVHLLFTDTDGPPPGEEAVTRTVTAALAAAVPELTGVPAPWTSRGPGPDPAAGRKPPRFLSYRRPAHGSNRVRAARAGRDGDSALSNGSNP